MIEQQILGREDERILVKEALGMLCTVSNPPSSTNSWEGLESISLLSEHLSFHIQQGICTHLFLRCSADNILCGAKKKTESGL